MADNLKYVRARAKQWQLGTANTGNEQVEVMFVVTDEQHELYGRHFTWYGYFSDKAIDRTFDALRNCGWDSDSIVELDNLAANEVLIALGEEEGQDGKLRVKVVFVNRLPGLNTKRAMDPNAAKAFADRLKGAAMAHKQKFGTQPTAASKPATNGARHAGRPKYQEEEPQPAWDNHDDLPF